MATVIPQGATGPNSEPMVVYEYKITGLTAGSNSISLPTAPTQGSFPALGDWTPQFVTCFPYQTGAAGALVTPDLTTITNSGGSVSFTLWSTGNTSCLIQVA